MRYSLFIIVFSLLLPFFGYSQAHNSLLKYGYKDISLIEFKDEIEREVELSLKPYAGKLDSIGFTDEDRDDLAKAWGNFFVESEFHKNDRVQHYLTQILKKVVPDSIIKKYNLRIYLTTELGFNAAAYQNGVIRWNLYNFIYLNNEAEIADILAHEAGHVMETDYKSLELLYDKVKKRAHQMIGSGIKRFEKLSQGSELEADEIGLKLMEKCGYKNDAYKHCFSLFEQIKLNNSFKKSKFKLSYNYIQTHPESKERTDNLNTLITSVRGEEFLVDEQLFNTIKKEATPFILEKMLYKNLYNECLELAMEEYLNDEGDDVLYYILESTRRIMYADKSMEKLPILSKYYPLGNMYDFAHYSNKIFLRPLDSLSLQKVRDKDIDSYKAYFEYFSEIAKERDLKDCYLPIGLYDYVQKNSKEYLQKLAESNPHYADFVAYVINPEETVKGFSKSQFMHTQVHFNRYSYSGFEIEQKYQEDTLIPIFNTYVEQQYNKVKPEGGELIKVYDLIDDDFSAYAKISGFYGFYWYINEENINTKKINQYILRPDLAVYMLKHKLKRMDFLDMFHCRDGQKVAKVLLSSNGYTPRFWTYSVVLHTSSITSNEFKRKSYDVGVGTVTRNSVLGVLKYNLLTSKNLSK